MSKTKWKDYTPDVSNLLEGLEFKSYKDMCLAVGHLPAGGNSRPKQESEFARFFRYHTDKYKCIIDEVYENPLPPKVYNDVFVTYVESILCAYLSTMKNYECDITYSKLYEVLNLVNSNYAHIKDYELDCEVFEYTNPDGTVCELPMSAYDDFVIRTGGKLRDVVRSALSSMKSRFLIANYYEQRVAVIKKDGNIQYVRLTPDEDSRITEIEYQERNKLGCNNVFDIKTRKLWGKFTYNVNRRLKEVDEEYTSTFKELHIVYSPRYMVEGCYESADELARIAEKNNIALNKNNLNMKIKQTLDDQAQSRYNAHAEKISSHEWGKQQDKAVRLYQLIPQHTYSSDYVDNQIKLSDIFIANKIECLEED